MANSIQIPNNQKQVPVINPALFTVWLLIVASIMLFAAFCSAYIVHQTDGQLNNNWKEFALPLEFWLSGGIVILTSVFIEWAFQAAKKDNINILPALFTITMILALAFCLSQWFGIQEMISKGLFFRNENSDEISSSFVYVFVGVHVVHIFFGICLLFAGIFKSAKLKIHKKNLLFITICKTYWHFLGILWLYLLLFLYFAK
ncbi:MAG: cytochrome c oxidase subunit 3 [Bacteroidia bacterium]|nr:cytochrome c oxidase subunit 3 [Bacteroidia bacterium]